MVRGAMILLAGFLMGLMPFCVAMDRQVVELRPLPIAEADPVVTEATDGMVTIKRTRRYRGPETEERGASGASQGPSFASTGESDVSGFTGGPPSFKLPYGTGGATAVPFNFNQVIKGITPENSLFYIFGLACFLGAAVLVWKRMLREATIVGALGGLSVATGVLINTYPWLLALLAIGVIGFGLWTAWDMWKAKQKAKESADRGRALNVVASSVEQLKAEDPAAAKKVTSKVKAAASASGHRSEIDSTIETAKRGEWQTI